MGRLGMSAPVAVVTGAARGLGLGIARHLAIAGFDLVLNHRHSHEAAARLVAELQAQGRQAVSLPGDVADPATAVALADAAAELGTLHVWVNNAGISTLAPLVETPPAELERMLAVNVMGVFHGLREAAVRMIASGTHGRIVNIASEAGVQAFPLLGAYSATKFAVVGLTQAAALELAVHGITVNAVCPGTAETDMVMAERKLEMAVTGRTADDVRGGYLDAIPSGRFCDPDDVGALVAFVAGAGASYLTGQALCTNGGSVLH
jgi:NAD(P)-dependent dehydrogenase (short-subunit alcohol dehydrogenase family)